jgi:tetratricopeptide (TPR) repeat protein
VEAAFLLGFTLLWSGRFQEAREHLQRCEDAAARTHERRRLVQAQCYLAVVDRCLLDQEATAVAAERARASAQEAGFPGYVAAAKANLGWVALRDGRAQEAENLTREALDLWQAPSAFPFEWLARGPLLALLLERGDAQGALRQAEGLLEPRQQRLPDGSHDVLQKALSDGLAGDFARAGDRLREFLTASPQLA